MTSKLNITACLWFKFLCVSLLSTLDSLGYYKKQHGGTASVNNCRVLTIVVEDVFKLSVIF